MPKFDVIITDRLTGKSYVHDTHPSRSLANEQASNIERSNYDTQYRVQVVEQLPKPKRKKNPCACRNSNPAPRPKVSDLAHDLLTEYHKNGEPAACKLFDKLSKTHDLMKRDEAALKKAFNQLLESATAPRRKNPVPPSKIVQARNAADLYTRFTGHDALEEVEIEKPVLPDVMLVVGDIDGVMYTTVRDGVNEKYVHQFKKSARPLFCVSHDGKQIHLIGGEYDFTERGIVDRT
jgi:hypothetical protein